MRWAGARSATSPTVGRARGVPPPDIDHACAGLQAGARINTHEGLKAVQMFEAIARGEIKALWVMGTVRRCRCRMPSGRAALKKLELFVVSENVRSNDTVDAGAHVLLPAETRTKSGTVTNSRRRICASAAFSTPPARASPTGWIVGEIASGSAFSAAIRFQFRRGRLPRARELCRRSRTTAPAISISAH